MAWKTSALKHTGIGLMKYSICMTNYNSKDTLSRCLESVLRQIDSEFEVVICDNCSTDGSIEIIEGFAKDKQIKLVVRPSNRGQGRQIAFENSVGKYILSGIDTDDVIKPVLKETLRLYHEKHEGYMLSFGTFCIIPRRLVTAVGGWRDLQYLEDMDFAKRIELMGKIHYFPDSSHIIIRGRTRRARALLYRLREEHMKYQCEYRIGHSVFRDIAINPVRPWYTRPILFWNALFAVALTKAKHLEKLEY